MTRRSTRVLFAAAAAAALMAASGAVATPVYNLKATLFEEYLTLNFDFPEGRPCQTFLRWDVRDRVSLIPVGAQPAVQIWALTFTSPIYTYNRCTSPRRLFGQPYATVGHPRKGWVHVNEARNRLRVPWTPWAQVCVHATRASATGASSGLTCVTTTAPPPG